MTEEQDDKTKRNFSKAKFYCSKDKVVHIVTYDKDYIDGYVINTEKDYFVVNRIDGKLPNPVEILYSDIYKFVDYLKDFKNLKVEK